MRSEEKPDDYKTLVAEKGRLSRTIGQKKRAGESVDALIAQMKIVSARLAALEDSKAGSLHSPVAEKTSTAVSEAVPPLFQPRVAGKETGANTRIRK